LRDAQGQRRNEERAKVKLRVYEFDLEGGNAIVENSIREIVQSIGARANVAPRPLPPKQQKELAPGGAPPEPDDTEPVIHDAEFSEVENGTAEASVSRPPRQRTTYKPRVPNNDPNLDLNGTGSISFKDFAAQKNPQKSTQRHLVAAFWLKEYANSPTINIDKAYTCYRAAEWPTDQSDWDVNFRQQVKTDRFRRVNPGEYAITPTGENDVRKMDGAK
jgi:hypothetical protein